MGFFLMLLLAIGALAFWMWKRPDPVQRDQAKAVHHDLWLEQIEAQLQHAIRLTQDSPQQDFERAYQIFQNLAKQHELPDAYVQMGLMQLNGQGREISIENAMGLLEQAFRLGSEQAAFALGQMFEGAQYGLNDSEKALYWYRHAVAKGHLEAQYRLADLAPEDDTHATQQRLGLLQQNAEQGHANSQYLLSQYYLEQTSDHTLGIEYLFRAAAQDHLKANQQLYQYAQQGRLGTAQSQLKLQYLKRCIRLGDHTALYTYYQAVLKGEIDVDQRQRVYADVLEQAKQHKNAQAKALLGFAHFHGWYLDKNETLGFRFWSEAAQLRNIDALNAIAALYYEKYLVADQPEKAFELYSIAEDTKANVFSEMGLGLCYLYGIGVAQDLQRAQQWLNQAAMAAWNYPVRTSADQDYVIGLFYNHDQYSLPQHDHAFDYLRKAAEQGLAIAAYDLYQMMLQRGFAVEQAMDYLIQSANQGHAPAQLRLAECYVTGQHIAQDLNQAVQYAHLAAEQGNADGLNALAEFYEQGVGVEADQVKAFELYQQAAKQLHGRALLHVGQYYLKGVSVQRDIQLAQQYFEKAALVGNVDALEQLENIQAYLKIM
jgi:uncharacterized protein